MSGYFEAQPPPGEIKERIEGYQSWLEVDLDAIGHNLMQVRERTGREVIPCVKSNAYGHGIVPVVAYMATQGVETVLVAKLHEALQIREAGLDVGIMNIDPLFTPGQFETVVRLGVSQTIYQRKPARMLSEAAGRLGETASLWVKVDTGLGRVGVKWSEAPDLIEEISVLPNLSIEGIFSTLSEAEELDRKQVQRLLAVEVELARQSMCFKARIEHVKWVEEGEALTYSRRFVAPRRMRVGTLHIGYSDGYPRGLTKKGKVKVGGEIRPVLGTVSVNHFLVDLTDTGCEPGDVVEAVSREGENDASSLSALAGIMTYSLANHLSPLLPRVYLKGGEPVALSEPKLVEK